MTYDEYVAGDNSAINQIASALTQARGGYAPSDLAHFSWKLLKEGVDLAAVLREIRGHDTSEPDRPTPTPTPTPSNVTSGLIVSASDESRRPILSRDEIRRFLPDRGRFQFPEPYNTIGHRITSANDGQVLPVGYSYWRNMNYHVGSDQILILIGMVRRENSGGPHLFSLEKSTGRVESRGSLFDLQSPFSWHTTEGWYFSGSRQLKMYCYMPEGSKLFRYDVWSRTFEEVFDLSRFLGDDKYIFQVQSSDDDRVHSMTIRARNSYAYLGAAVYIEPEDRFEFFQQRGNFDECQIDKSGRWLVIKENVDNKHGEDNRIIDLQDGSERLLLDEHGAAGHSDLGYGVMIAEDNFHEFPGAVRLWDLAQPDRPGRLVYHLPQQSDSWSTGLGHIAYGCAKMMAGYAFVSNANRVNAPRVNEIVRITLDGSMRSRVVAPNLVDLDAMPGTDYTKLPKGNCDVTGEYFLWTSNAGSPLLDAFLVHVPRE